MKRFLDATNFLSRLIGNTLKPRPRMTFWEWGDKNVTIPPGAGPMPGKLNTGRLPIFRGLYDLAQHRTTRNFALCASARVGKTLFSIVIMLYWLAERAADVVWLDPSGPSARKVSKAEIEPFIEACPPVWRLAVLGRTTWQILWKQFAGKVLRIVGSGAEADLHGFNAELAIGNELDRQEQAHINRKGKKGEGEEDASAMDKIGERTILFPWTRLIIENSTPGKGGEFSQIWNSFLRGSQHHCYVPCPHCSAEAKAKGVMSYIPDKLPVGWSAKGNDSYLAGWQRLTFSADKAAVPFTVNCLPLLGDDGKLKTKTEWREETTGRFKFEQFAIWREVVSPGDATKTTRKKFGYRLDDLEEGTTYECAHCKKDIINVQFRWMIERYRWVAHNPEAPASRVSAHVWRAYCPPELGGSLGRIASEFLTAKNDIGQLIKWTNLTCGLPFIRTGSAVKDADLERVIARTPVRYVKGQLPIEAELLLMTVDKQKDHFWYVVRAYGILWEHPDWPMWSAVVDWGQANSYDELLQLSGNKAEASGEFRRFKYTNPTTGIERVYPAFGGLIDSGDEAENVYQFCARNFTFEPYKGGGPQHTRFSPIRMSMVLDESLPLWVCWSDHFSHNLYMDCIKYGSIHGETQHWWLPVDIDEDYRKQLTDEFKDEDGWHSRTRNNHLGDCEKMQRVLAGGADIRLEEIRDMRAKALKDALTAPK